MKIMVWIFGRGSRSQSVLVEDHLCLESRIFPGNHTVQLFSNMRPILPRIYRGRSLRRHFSKFAIDDQKARISLCD